MYNCLRHSSSLELSFKCRSDFFMEFRVSTYAGLMETRKDHEIFTVVKYL